MARGISISLIGRADAEKRITACRDLLNSEAVQDAILPAAQLVRDVAKRLAPLGTGLRTGKASRGERRLHLRDAIFASKGKRRARGVVVSALQGEGGPSVVAGIMGAQAPHAHLVEFGHGGKRPAPAHPFMRPAATAVRWAVVQIIENALKRMLAPFSR